MGFSTPEIILVVLIAVLVFMVGFRFRPRHERSPFALFGVAPGMSVSEMRKAAAQRKGTLDCRPQYDHYQYCALKLIPEPGIVGAVVDSKDRAIVVQAVAVSGLEGLYFQADTAATAWSAITQGAPVPPLVDRGDTGAVRWASPDHRWTAELHYGGSRDPDVARQVTIVDTRALHRLVAVSASAAADAKELGWIPPTAEEAAAAFEQHRRNRKSDYGALATTLSQLGDFEAAHFNAHHTYTDNVSDLPGMFIIGATHLEILSATDSGWTAKATLSGFPNSGCVAIGGRVPSAELPVTVGGRSVTSADGVTCDPLPAER